MLKKIAVVLCLTMLFAVGCKKEVEQDDLAKNGAGTQDSAKNEAGTQDLAKKVEEDANYQLKPPSKGDTIAIMKTTMGDIKLKFFEKEAPKTVENFTGLAKKGYYKGVQFHRVIKDFMIQGGDPTATGSGGTSIWDKPFEDEFSDNLHLYRGSLCMANSGPNTNGSQFFIVQMAKVDPAEKDTYVQKLGISAELFEGYVKNGGTAWLEKKHTVFGQVFEGMDVVDKLANVPVNSPAENRPVQEVKMTDVEITTFQ